jgi:desulfoferrodoxin (superoxide reductase-like protein)
MGENEDIFQCLKLMLIVPKVEEAVCWYTSTLDGHLCHSLTERHHYEWTSLYLDDVEVMFAEVNLGARGSQIKLWYQRRPSI